ncbi:MbeB family mobilization protein [Psychrobacter faecalis]
MSEILSLAQNFKKQSNETAALIETTLQDDLGKLHASFMKSLIESESIIKQGTESLDEKQSQLKTMLEQHHQAIEGVLVRHLFSVQALTTESLEKQKLDIAEMMNEYSQELSQTMQAHQENALDFVYRRAWVVVIGCAIVALVMMGFGVMLGMKLG